MVCVEGVDILKAMQCLISGMERDRVARVETQDRVKSLESRDTQKSATRFKIIIRYRHSRDRSQGCRWRGGWQRNRGGEKKNRGGLRGGGAGEGERRRRDGRTHDT